MARTKLRGYQIGDYEILLTHLKADIQIPTANLAEGSSFIKREGSVSMTGALNMGNNVISNVANGVAATDVVSVGQLTVSGSNQTAALNAEITARTAADATEATARTNADTTLQANINTEITARTNADTALTNADAAEATARANADTTLQANINTEITARTAAITGVSNDLLAEVTARTAADTAIRSDLASNAVSVGASLVGIQDAGSLYNATNVEAALAEVVTKINNAQGQLSLQGVYDNTAAVGGVANIQLTTGKDFRLTDDTDSTIFFQVDSETGAVKMTGPVNIEGSLFVSGSTTQINSTVTSYDFITLAPSGAGKALEIRPTAAYTGNSVLEVFTSSGAATSAFEIGTDNVVDVQYIRIQGVDVASSLLAETTARVAGDAAIQASLNTEITARTTADTLIQTNLASTSNGLGASLVGVEDAAGNYVATNVEGVLAEIFTNSTTSGTNFTSALNAEITARTNADTTLQANINTEITARTAADTALQVNINTEATTRADADTTLQANINTEITARTNADTTLTNAVAAEVTARTNADTTLQANINAEATTRADADTTLQANINTEITARISGDSNLNSLIASEASTRATADDLKYDKIGGTISGNVSISGTLGVTGQTTLATTDINALRVVTSFDGNAIRLTNVADGVATQDVVTMNQLSAAIAGTGTSAEWQESAISIVNDPPNSPAVGDRYLIGTAPTGSFATHMNAIAEYTSVGWAFTTFESSKTGTFLSVDSQTDRIYYWGGTSWAVKYFEATTASNGVVKTGFNIELDSTVAGSGLTFNSGIINVVGGDGLTANADQLNLVLDGTTLTKTATGLKVNAAGITSTQLATSVAGNGLTGGNGSALSVVAGNGIAVGADTSVKISTDANAGLVFGTDSGLKVATNTMTADRMVFRDPFTGVIDGSNTVFTLSRTPIVGTETVFLNGSLQNPSGEDYSIVGDVITFITAPLVNERLTINFIS